MLIWCGMCLLGFIFWSIKSVIHSRKRKADAQRQIEHPIPDNPRWVFNPRHKLYKQPKIKAKSTRIQYWWLYDDWKNKKNVYVFIYWLWITSSSDISNWTFFSASARILRTFNFASRAAWRAKKFFFGPLPVIGRFGVGVGPDTDVGDVAAFSTAAAVELDTIFSKKYMTQKSNKIPWEHLGSKLYLWIREWVRQQ